jgi:hypothetical protein
VELASVIVAASAAVFSLVSVVLLARLTGVSEHRKWLREARLEAAVSLKLDVAKVRVFRRKPDATYAEMDFSPVNTSLARVELVGDAKQRALVEELRDALRNFVRITPDSEDWRGARDKVDGLVAALMASIREQIQ